jgi:hypothetical protein
MAIKTANNDNSLIDTLGSKLDIAGGKILQTVQAIKTDTQVISGATSGTTQDITGLTASITPSSTSNKILIFGTVSGCRGDDGGSPVMDIALVVRRGGTTISAATGDAAGNRSRVFGTNRAGLNTVMNQVSLLYLDSPNTTSSVAYSVGWVVTASTTLYVNRSQTDTDAVGFLRAVSNLVVMEVSA